MDRPQTGPISPWLMLWLVLTLIGAGLLAAHLWGSGHGWTLPDWARIAAVVLIATTYTWGIAHRTDENPWLAAGLGAVVSAGLLLSGVDWLVAGLTVALTVVSALFGVLVTKAATSWLQVARELLIASVASVVGALAVYGAGGSVDPMKYSYAALAIALLWMIAIVYGLGAALHGLGKRGVGMVLVGTLMLAIALAYGEAIRRWGSPSLVLNIETFRSRVLTAIYAVPRPLAALLGFPALAWGVFMRSRRRQGWWASAFGVAATVAIAGMFEGLGPARAFLGLLYTLIIGLLIGLLVIRLDRYFTGSRGARASAPAGAGDVVPEPGRTASLR